MILDITTFEFYSKKFSLSNLKIVGPAGYNYSYGFGIQKDNLQLLSIVNKLLDNLSLERKNEIYSKWIKIDYNETINLLKNNVVDGIIGNLDEINEKGVKLEYEELDSSKVLRIANEGVIVIKKGNRTLKKIIQKTIDKEYIKKVQNEVLNNNILPTY